MKKQIFFRTPYLILIYVISEQAVYSTTCRGRIQLIYCGQPFNFERTSLLHNGEEKTYWRCNQWWSQKCRSRLYTQNHIIVPLNKQHKHNGVVNRPKKKAKKCTKSVEHTGSVESGPTYKIIPDEDEIECESEIPSKYEIEIDENY